MEGLTYDKAMENLTIREFKYHFSINKEIAIIIFIIYGHASFRICKELYFKRFSFRSLEWLDQEEVKKTMDAALTKEKVWR
ncbi:MAG: hypothetical protein ACRC68_00475 [Clostridium sp.]